MSDLAGRITECRGRIGMTDRQVIGELLQAADADMDFTGGDNCYTWWLALGFVMKPRKVVEIGTRFGYSLKAIVEGSGQRPCDYSLWVYDMECDITTPEPLRVMETYFRGRLGIADLHVHRVDTQRLQSLGVTGADLVVVDADHTAAGCYHDCVMAFAALRPGGVMAVDDTHPGWQPRIGCEGFCLERGLPFVYLPTLRGVHLIEKPGEP